MEESMAQVSQTVSKMIPVETGLAVWELQDWNKLHNLLAQTSCLLKIGDVDLCFFLKPQTETVQVQTNILSVTTHSLYVKNVDSCVRPAFLKIAAQVTETTEGKVQETVPFSANFMLKGKEEVKVFNRLFAVEKSTFQLTSAWITCRVQEGSWSNSWFDLPEKVQIKISATRLEPEVQQYTPEKKI